MKYLVVNKDTKKEAIKQLDGGKPILIMYKMEMCPHCIALQPVWNEVRDAMSNNQSLEMAEVEYQNMPLLPSKLRNISAFPSILMIQNGKVKDEYTGDRTVPSIMSFALSNVPAAASKTTKDTKSLKSPKTAAKKTATSKKTTK